jgi:DNA-binding transcriptional MerR regulator
MDDKAPDAFRTISEAAEELDLPQHVLRFWESRFREIKPMKRGGGRRYYRPDDLDLLRGIKHLLYGEGYTIRGVQRILRENGIKFVQAVWEEGAEQPAHVAAEDVDEEAAAPEVFTQEQGLGARLTSFFGRDLNGSNSEHRREPPLGEPAPSVRLGSSDRAIHAATMEEVDEDEPVLAKPNGVGLDKQGLETLRSVLHDLMECRKLIDAAVARPE